MTSRRRASTEAALDLAAWLAPRVREWRAGGGRPRVLADRVDDDILDSLGWSVVEDAVNTHDAVIRAVGGSVEQTVDPRAAARALTFGQSLQLEHLEDTSEAYRVLSGELGWRLGADRVRTNIYVTPPGGAGFRIHRDEVEAAVVQIDGGKHWSVFETPVPNARSVMWEHRPHDGSPPILDVDLERGQVLCVQAGYPHLVRATSGGTSLHVTIGIYPVDATDFLEFVKAEVAREAWARTPLPWTDPEDPHGDARRAWAGAAGSQIAQWLSEAEPGELLDRFLAFRAQSFAPRAALELREALDDRKRLDSACRVMLTDPRTPVHFGSDSVTLPGRRLVVERGPRQDALRDLLGARSRPTAPLAEIADRHGLAREALVDLARELVDLGTIRIFDQQAR